MDAAMRELEAAVMALPDSERARLAEKLLSSLDRDPEVEEAWAQEIRRRVEQYRSGNLDTVSAEAVMKEARERIQS
jgi:putative addiction module component (TIGR02574 family)